jgi:hypothetical protein
MKKTSFFPSRLEWPPAPFSWHNQRSLNSPTTHSSKKNNSDLATMIILTLPY